MFGLEYLLNTTKTQSFLDEYLYKKALYIPGDKNRFTNLFDWESLNDVLSTIVLCNQKVKISNEDNPFFVESASRVLEEIARGSTIVVENLDHYDRKIKEFINAFSHEIGVNSRINLYFSQPGTVGYNIHYDTHDFFILQIEGEKEWKIYSETVAWPLFDQKQHGLQPPSEESLYLSCTLKKGDVLYVPKGHWHKVLCTKEPSIHFTLGMFIPTGIDFLEWFVSELREDPEIRKTFPLLLQREGLDMRLKSYMTQLEQLVSGKINGMDGSLLTEFLRYKVAKETDRIPFSLPYQFTVKDSMFSNTTRFRKIPHSIFVSSKDETIEVVFSGRILVLDKLSKPLLSYILDHDIFSRKDLLEVSGLSYEQLSEIMIVFIKNGIVTIID